MTDEQFLQVVKKQVCGIDPQAEVWLFGSRARGDARADSDWDFLVFTNNDLSRGRRWQFSDKLYDIQLETGRMISTVVWPQRERRRYEVTDLYQNVMDEGIRL
ncbi:nucleotidyltransferase domain-containing protein [Spirosoma aerophilum]